MTALPLNSVIASAVLTSPSSVFVKGYAVPCYSDPYLERNTEPCNISRVEVTADGQSWHQARIIYQEGKWSWTLWEVEVSLTPNHDENVEICSRAVDNRGNVQPRDGVWNLRGVAWNAWGRRKVTL